MRNVALPAIDVNNKAFAEDAISAGLNNATLIPSYVSVPSMQNDMTLFNQLEEISGIVNQLQENWKIQSYLQVVKPTRQHWHYTNYLEPHQMLECRVQMLL